MTHYLVVVVVGNRKAGEGRSPGGSNPEGVVVARSNPEGAAAAGNSLVGAADHSFVGAADHSLELKG